MRNYKHAGPPCRAVAIALREAMALPAGAERESKINLALLKLAEAMDAIASQYHGS